MSEDNKDVRKLAGKPFILKDLIAYQEEAIVSKLLIKKETGTVTLFAFDEGQKLSTHSAPFDALVYVIDGQAQIMISQEFFTVKKDEILLLPAHKPHAVEARKRFKMVLTMIKS